jgi:hypothetical protein
LKKLSRVRENFLYNQLPEILEGGAMAEKELLPGLTPRVLVLMVLITAIYYIPTLYLWNLSDRPYTFSGGFISYFWIIMFLTFLGSLSPKLRLTKQEAVVLMVPFWILTGSAS